MTTPPIAHVVFLGLWAGRSVFGRVKQKRDCSNGTPELAGEVARIAEFPCPVSAVTPGAVRSYTKVAKGALLLIAACASSVTSAEAEFAITGYGTLGYARSDAEFRYLRYIDDEGTFRVDSIVGAQLEARFNAQWGATVQGVVSAPRTRDNGIEASIRWAFVSFRPDNDWLFRVGRFRPPVLLNTQNAEVGVTYNVARLPAEVYSISPVYDLDGGSFTKTWAFGQSDLGLDGYAGKTRINYRLPYQRYTDLQYFPEELTVGGLVFTYTRKSLLLRAGIHNAAIESKADQPFYEMIAPFAVLGAPPAGGIVYQPTNPTSRVHLAVLTLGADWEFQDWQITAEYGQRFVRDSDQFPKSKSGYATVARTLGHWTPYLTYARLLTDRGQRSLYRSLNDTPVPSNALRPPVTPQFHAMLADSMVVFDQYSTMLGASYTFSPNSKLKVEWMRTKVGLVSAFVDADVHNQYFNVYSISYSVGF